MARPSRCSPARRAATATWRKERVPPMSVSGLPCTDVSQVARFPSSIWGWVLQIKFHARLPRLGLVSPQWSRALGGVPKFRVLREQDKVYCQRQTTLPPPDPLRRRTEAQAMPRMRRADASGGMNRLAATRPLLLLVAALQVCGPAAGFRAALPAVLSSQRTRLGGPHRSLVMGLGRDFADFGPALVPWVILWHTTYSVRLWRNICREEGPLYKSRTGREVPLRKLAQQPQTSLPAPGQMHRAQENMRAALARLLALQSERQELQLWQRAARKLQAWLFLSPLWPVLVGMTSVCARALCICPYARPSVYVCCVCGCSYQTYTLTHTGTDGVDVHRGRRPVSARIHSCMAHESTSS